MSSEIQCAPSGLSPAEHGRASELFEQLFGELREIGRAEDGSSTRLAWTEELAQAEAWFDATAGRLGLTVTVDGNGNRWAGSESEATGLIVTGSHLDTVPRGGSFDGALGVVSGLIATSLVLARGRTVRPLAVVAFADEEGGRFNTPTFGSRLLVGSLEPDEALSRADAAGVTLRQALQQAGLDPARLGPDEGLLSRLACLVELHIEQGSLLTACDQPIGIATEIIPHGRWRVDLVGQSNHGGTTALGDRRDPMVPLAELLRAGRAAAELEDSLVTVGKLDIWPNAPTSIAERVSAWVDVRSQEDDALERIVEELEGAVRTSAEGEGVEVAVRRESRSAGVRFSAPLADRISRALVAAGIEPVPLSTGAGHDAGVLAARIPTAMLFVRNQTGISHAREERVAVEDCLTGIAALTTALDELSSADGGL